MHKALHHRENVDRLYVSRKVGRRGHASIENIVDASIQRREDYIEKYEGRLITAIRNETDDAMANEMTKKRKQKLEEKKLYGRFKWPINNILLEKTRTWPRKETLREKLKLS